MSDPFDSDVTNLMSSALHQALARLRTLGLIDGNAEPASSILSRLILEAAEAGERNQENLILFAIGRFQVENRVGK
jgi:hypothetical protein